MLLFQSLRQFAQYFINDLELNLFGKGIEITISSILLMNSGLKVCLTKFSTSDLFSFLSKNLLPRLDVIYDDCVFEIDHPAL